MTGSGAGDAHLGFGGDAAGVLRIRHHGPFSVRTLDFENRAAVRHHLDLDQLARNALEADVLGVLAANAREHQFFVGVFVIDNQQAVIRAAVDRDVAEVIVVIAELARLGLGGLLLGIEVGRVRQHLVAPADQHIGVVAFRDVVVWVGTGSYFLEVEAWRGAGRGFGISADHGGQRGEHRRYRGYGQRAAHDIAAAVAGRDHIAHGRVGAGVRARVLGFFVLGGKRQMAALVHLDLQNWGRVERDLAALRELPMTERRCAARSMLRRTMM